MRHRIIRAFCAPILLLCALAAPSFAAPAHSGFDLSRYVQREMLRDHIPGMAVAIVNHGRIVVEKAYGVANLEWNAPVTLHTPFQLASATKLLTATALMRLVQERKLSLGDTVGDYLPDVPATLKPITVQQIASHQSGIPMTPLNAPARTFDDALRLAESQNLQWAPGSRVGYVSDDYIILRAIMERVSRQPYEEFIKSTILAPLDMADTSFDDTSDDGVIQTSTPIPRRVDNYKWDGRRELLFHGTYRWASAAGAFASIDDLAKWAVSLDRQTLLNQESIATMAEAVKLADGSNGPFGEGVVVAQRNGEPIFGHSGGPALADVIHYVKHDFTVIVLTNQITLTPHLAGDIGDAYLSAIGSAPNPSL